MALKERVVELNKGRVIRHEDRELTQAEEDAVRAEWSAGPTLDEAKAAKRDAVNAEYMACLERGVEWNGTRWTATDAGRDTLVELHEVAQQDGVSVTVLDANNAAHTLSETDLGNLRAAGRTYRRQARENRLSLLQQVAAASSVADVDAVDETAGWP